MQGRKIWTICLLLESSMMGTRRAHCIVSHLGGGCGGALWRKWLVYFRYGIVKIGTEAPNVT